MALFLDQNDPSIKEFGLESLCEWYRRGFWIRNPHPIRQRLSGLLFHPLPQIVRWALNAIALVGIADECLLPTIDAIQRYRDNPDVLASGVAALVKFIPPDEVIATLKVADVPFEGASLIAAAQYTDAFLDKLLHNRVKPDVAGAPELRMATVLVGLNKAPENLFEPKYPNSEIVGILNTHHDKKVAQYSIWAICENEFLSISDLKIPLISVENCPENVRGWIYKLLAASPESALKNRDLISVGSEDKSKIARLGLAGGLHNTYFDGIEELTFDWLGTETDVQVKLALLDHMAKHNQQCPAYKSLVVEEYRAAPTNSVTRARLDAASAGTSLYAALKRIALEADASLMSFDATQESNKPKVTIVNQNIKGHIVTIGNLAGRDGVVRGGVHISQTMEQAQSELAKLNDLLAHSKEKGVEDGQRLTSEAVSAPSKSTISNLLRWMETVSKAGALAVASTTSFGQIYEALAHVILQLPH